MAHVSHYAIDWSALSIATIGRSAFRRKAFVESWAESVELEIALREFGTHTSHHAYQDGSIRDNQDKSIIYWKELEGYIGVIGQNLKDNLNQYLSSSNVPVDRVRGYTFYQMANALKGATEMREWRENLKDRYDNSTEDNLEEYFKSFDDAF